MARKTWPLAVLVSLLLQSNWAWCQTVLPAPTVIAPVPEVKPAAYVLPPVYHSPQVEPMPTPFADEVRAPGIIGNVELLLLRPHLNAHLTGSPNQGVDTVTLGMAGPLGTTVAPQFELGYRLPEQLGEFVVSYRFEGEQRTFVPTDFLGGNSERDRLSMSIVDVDWSNHNPFSLGPGWDLRFNVGVRVGIIYFDTQRDFASSGNAAGQLSERVTNDFVGVGPEAGVELSRQVFLPGLAVYGRLAGSELFGNIRQSFSETTTGVGSPPFAGDASHFQVAVENLTVKVGLSYCPPNWNTSRFTAGYVWEEFWHIGRLNDNNADLANRGFFVRAEWDF